MGECYFGTGGLVKAYSESLQEAILKAEIVKQCMGEEVEVCFEYSEFQKVKYYCENEDINISNIQYLENIVCTLEILEGEMNKILKDFQLKSIKINDYHVLDKKFITRKR